MGPVRTAFFTRCWRSIPTSRWLLGALALCLAVMAVEPAHGNTRVDLIELRVERGDDGLYLSARLGFQLPTAIEDALQKGIPVHFVADADVFRERWYWYDSEISSAQRYMRVAYQPLTRRWRLNTSSEPITAAGLGVGLTQYYDSLADVMASVQRISRWRIATAAELEQGGRQTLRFRFRLDTSQLPRAFQIGAIGESDWMLSIERRIDLTHEALR